MQGPEYIMNTSKVLSQALSISFESTNMCMCEV